MKTEKTVRLVESELVGFDRFVAYHYQESFRKAKKIVDEAFGLREANDQEAFQMMLKVFDKLASPLVYLPSKWRYELTDSQRLSYFPDAEQRAKKGAEIAEEAKASITA